MQRARRESANRKPVAKAVTKPAHFIGLFKFFHDLVRAEIVLDPQDRLSQKWCFSERGKADVSKNTKHDDILFRDIQK